MKISNENEPLVSVVMPVYNCSEYLGNSIASVIAQSYKNWELLAVDDCSTDDSAEIVKYYAGLDCRIRYIGLSENSGAAAARNRAIEDARGQYIAFLDSDDLWHPRKLEVQIGYMENNHIAFTCTAYRYLDGKGEMTGKANFPFESCDYWKCLYFGNSIGNSTAVYSVRPHGKIYVPDIRKRNDFALWLRILKYEPCVIGIQEMLTDYRIREGSLSTDKRNLMKYQWKLYRNIEKLPVHHCVLALGCLVLRKIHNPNIRDV